MTGQILNVILNLGLAAVAVMLLVGLIRGRARYRNIKPSEIDSNVASGEELLRDALNEGHQGDVHNHADDG